MKILLLTDGIYPLQIGGMQKHSLQLLKYFLKEGMTVCVARPGIVKSERTPLDEHLFEGAKEYTEVTAPFPKRGRLPGHYIRANKLYSASLYDQLEDQLDQFDLIYVQGFAGWRFVKMKQNGMFDTPVFLNFHGYEMFQKAANTRTKMAYAMLRTSVNWNVKRADYIYSFGGQISRIIQEIGIQKEKILLQSNAIDTKWLHSEIIPSEKSRKFIFVGRAERRKGIEELNAAIQVLLADSAMNEVSFSFVGPVNEKLQLAHPQVQYHGEVREEEEMKSLLRQADCLVCPSYAEGMPTVILEAMACGLAIIGTDVGAVSRQISDNGILLPEPRVPLLRDALREVALDTNMALDQKKEASLRSVRKNFTWEAVINEKIDQMKKVVSSEAPR